MASWIGSPELKVGILVIAVSALIGTMALKVAEGPSVLSGAKKYYFKADSAGGLVPNSAVKMAGIKVGVIKDIVLEEGRARVIITLEGDTQLTESTRVELRADGILGDKHVELVPGRLDDPKLPAGSELILATGKGGGMDDVMADVSKVARSLNEVLEVIKRATQQGDDSTPIGRIVRNIENLTGDISEITSENKEKISEIVDRVRNLSKNIDTYINEESLARVDRSLRNIEDITAKLAKGEGTLGRLINDEATVEELNSAITNVNKFLGGADKLETSLDFHSEFLAGPSETKSFLGLKIQPGLDRYYEVQVVDDPQGTKRSTFTTTSTNGGPNQTYEETTVYRNKLKITGLFAKNFYDWTIKGGLIENAGGIGVDYHLMGRKLRFSTEFFDFKEPQLRVFARYNFFKGVYLVAGGDNLLSSGDEPASAFVGGGIFITTDDLKLLASKMSF